jgi:hypothetical protein
LLAGPAGSPQAVDRRVIALSDPAVPDSSQPYHALLELSEREGAKLEKRLVGIVEERTRRSIGELLETYRARSREPSRAALAVGSLTDPAGIGNPHIRAHALEGRLFRTALERALRPHGLPCSVLVEREAYSKAAGVLGRSEGELKRAVTELGRPLGGPWRADEKIAALAAWMALD